MDFTLFSYFLNFAFSNMIISRYTAREWKGNRGAPPQLPLFSFTSIQIPIKKKYKTNLQTQNHRNPNIKLRLPGFMMECPHPQQRSHRAPNHRQKQQLRLRNPPLIRLRLTLIHSIDAECKYIYSDQIKIKNITNCYLHVRISFLSSGYSQSASLLAHNQITPLYRIPTWIPISNSLLPIQTFTTPFVTCPYSEYFNTPEISSASLPQLTQNSHHTRHTSIPEPLSPQGLTPRESISHQ